MALALPWDTDLYRQQSYQPGELARSPAPGTYPVGREIWSLTTEQAASQLSNPTEVSKNSIWRGRRVWETNCRICHGPAGKGNGPVGAPLMAVPNILEGIYLDRTDGHIYGVLMNGGANMPRYGYKFSDGERWDVVNYVRFLQNKAGTAVEGIARPQQ